MPKLKAVIAIAIIGLFSLAGWQVGSCVVSNAELRDEMQDMASQLSGRIGLGSPSSDEDFRQGILQHARENGIELSPDQITVRRTGPSQEEEIYLAADYVRPVHLLGATFRIHFHPEARKKFQPSDWR